MIVILYLQPSKWYCVDFVNIQQRSRKIISELKKITSLSIRTIFHPEMMDSFEKNVFRDVDSVRVFQVCNQLY